jgi:exodeoxyribonuclease III
MSQTLKRTSDALVQTVTSTTKVQKLNHHTSAKHGPLKLCSWNILSWKTFLKKDFLKYLKEQDVDIVLLQETKLNSDPSIPEEAENESGTKSKSKKKKVEKDEGVTMDDVRKVFPFTVFNHCKTSKGYSGTAILSKYEPLQVIKGFRYLESTRKDVSTKQLLEDEEGRIISIELNDVVVINTYVPNAGNGLKRLDWKVNIWNKAMNDHLAYLKETLKKPIVWGGDMNVAPEEIDLARPKENLNKTAGFTDAERNSIKETWKLHSMVDVYRHMHKEKQEFTYFSFRFNAKQKNLGWRLDFFFIEEEHLDKVKDITIDTEQHGLSDHVPLLIIIDFSK